LADHRWDQAAWRRQLIRVTPAWKTRLNEEMWARLDATRREGAPAPISWEMARPGDPGVADIARRLLLLIDRHERFKAANSLFGRHHGVPAELGVYDQVVDMAMRRRYGAGWNSIVASGWCREPGGYAKCRSVPLHCPFVYADRLPTWAGLGGADA
jgi:hypothetical protein